MPTMFVPFLAAKRNNVEIIGIKKNLILPPFHIIATLLNSRTPKQFLEKKDAESKKKRDPCKRREIERVYCPKRKC